MAVVGLGGCAALVASIGGGLEDTAPEQVDSKADGGHAEPSGDKSTGEDRADTKTYGVGDTVKMGSLEHTVHAARWNTGDEFIGPEEGQRWLTLDVELTNTGDTSEAITSMGMWKLLDSEHRSADLEITADAAGQLDGELAAGRSMRGELTFGVSDEGPWELEFNPELLGFGQAIFQISDADIDGGDA